MQQPQSAYRNQLLKTLAPNDFKALAPHLEAVSLHERLTLGFADRPIQRVCFPESGIISVMAVSQRLGAIDVGLIGFEGMTGVPVVLGDTQAPEETRVQIAGVGHCVDVQAFSALLEQHSAMRRTMLHYAHAFDIQVAQGALASGMAKIVIRLARWLLMAADRIGVEGMPLKHELLAEMLGVHRPGITDAVHRLEGDGMIRARRSAITITNRAALEVLAGGAYGVPEREYMRIMGGHALLGHTPAEARISVT